MQCPHATRVAGYRTWQSLGRQVRKGETAIKIFAPLRFTHLDEQTGEARVGIRGFTVEHVFDISQTDGDALPTVDVPDLAGSDGAELYEALVRYAGTLTPPVPVTMHDPLTNGDDRQSSYGGYYHRRERYIFVKRTNPLQQARVIVHELGHALDPELGTTPRDERETVAEATAFLVTAHFGLDTTAASFPYIATWCQQQDGAELIRRTLARTQRIARQIIDGAEALLSPPPLPPAVTMEVAAWPSTTVR